MNNLLFLAYSQHSLFDDMLHSLGRGVMYAGAFRIMRSLSMPGAIALVLLVLAVRGCSVEGHDDPPGWSWSTRGSRKMLLKYPPDTTTGDAMKLLAGAVRDELARICPGDDPSYLIRLSSFSEELSRCLGERMETVVWVLREVAAKLERECGIDDDGSDWKFGNRPWPG